MSPFGTVCVVPAFSIWHRSWPLIQSRCRPILGALRPNRGPPCWRLPLAVRRGPYGGGMWRVDHLKGATSRESVNSRGAQCLVWWRAEACPQTSGSGAKARDLPQVVVALGPRLTAEWTLRRRSAGKAVRLLAGTGVGDGTTVSSATSASSGWVVGERDHHLGVVLRRAAADECTYVSRREAAGGGGREGAEEPLPVRPHRPPPAASPPAATSGDSPHALPCHYRC
jgi:hypothetical protein